jgi:hypothetical protein
MKRSFFSALQPKFLGSDPVPAFERAVKRRRLGVSQQIRDLADRKIEGQVDASSIPPPGVMS